jgi:hypothetical protein
MAQKTQQPILKMEITNNYIHTQHLVGVGEVRVYLIELGPSICLMDTRVYHFGKCRDWCSTEEISDAIGASFLYLMLRWNCCKYVDQF